MSVQTKIYRCAAFAMIFCSLSISALADMNVGDHVYIPAREGGFEIGKIKKNANGSFQVEPLSGGEKTVKAQDLKDLNPRGSVNTLMMMSRKDQMDFESFLFGGVGVPGKWQAYLEQDRERLPGPEKKAVKKAHDIRESWAKPRTGMPLYDAKLEIESLIRVAEENPDAEPAVPTFKRYLSILEAMTKEMKVAKELAASRAKDEADDVMTEASRLLAESDKFYQKLKNAQTNADRIKKEVEHTTEKMLRRTSGTELAGVKTVPVVSSSDSRGAPSRGVASVPKVQAPVKPAAGKSPKMPATNEPVGPVPLPNTSEPGSDDSLLDSLDVQ